MIEEATIDTRIIVSLVDIIISTSHGHNKHFIACTEWIGALFLPPNHTA